MTRQFSIWRVSEECGVQGSMPYATGENAPADAEVVFTSEDYWETDAEYSRLMSEAGMLLHREGEAGGTWYAPDAEDVTSLVERFGVTVEQVREWWGIYGRPPMQKWLNGVTAEEWQNR